ncbi:MAG: hypothetical protein IJL62_05600 [Clostridia bacterium]|nr:hypothetical protein [Clostridia bacterium]
MEKTEKKKNVELTEEEIEAILEQQAPPLTLPKFMESRRFHFFAALISVLCMAILPMLILWSKNTGGLNFLEGLWPVAVALVVGLIVFVLTWFLSKKNAPVTAFAGSAISFFFLDFGLYISIAKKILPFLPVAVGALIVGVLLSAAILIVVIKLRNSKALMIAMSVFALALVLLTAFNSVRIAIRTIERVSMFRPYEAYQSDPVVPEKTAAKSDAQPNIYYFIMDEAGDFSTMERYYDIPTEENPYYQYCQEKGFSVSLNSSAYTNRSLYCIANLFSLQYVCTPETESPDARIYAFTGEWFDDLHALGYKTYQVSTHTSHYLQLKELSDPTFTEELLCSVTFDGSSMLDLFIDTSILSLVKEFAGDGVSFIDEIGAGIFKMRLKRVSDFYADPSNYTYDAPMAIHTYLLPPHTPFFIDAEGNTVSTKYRCNWVDHKYYLDQWMYMEKYMEEIIDNIFRYDPNAIIIVQSDHGARGGLWQNDYNAENYDIEKTDQCRILNTVYFCGEPIEIEGLSAVNTARAILTKLGSNRPPIPDADYIFWQDQVDPEESGDIEEKGF